MSKGQKRSNREIRKPKKTAAQRSAEIAQPAAVRAGQSVTAVFKKKT